MFEEYLIVKLLKDSPAENLEANVEGRRTVDKAPVVTLVEHDGRVKSQHMESVTGENLKKALLESVEIMAIVNSDESPSYFGVNQHFAEHKAVNHKKGEYVRGELTLIRLKVFTRYSNAALSEHFTISVKSIYIAI